MASIHLGERRSRTAVYTAVAAGLLLIATWTITTESHIASWLAYARAGFPAGPPPLEYNPEIPDDPEDDLFIPFHEFFQDDLPNPNPNFHTHKLRTYKPHNYDGPGQKTFATYLATRRGTMHDPYFAAAQQLVYRMLWDPKIKSEYPFTVFVAPFIADAQRDVLAAAGAIVRELPLLEWHASQITNGRWKDMFAKLNIWDQDDFDQIVLLDTDAFPIENLDGVFDVTKMQECDREKIAEDDMEELDDACDYLFSAVEHKNGQLNGGVLIAKPNKALHRRMLHHMLIDDFDASLMEQSFLNHFFDQDGPFPAQFIPREWNGFVPQEDEEGKLKVLHDKLWTIDTWEDRNLTWALHMFNDTWDDMIKLYESKEFETLRAADGPRLY